MNRMDGLIKEIFCREHHSFDYMNMQSARKVDDFLLSLNVTISWFENGNKAPVNNIVPRRKNVKHLAETMSLFQLFFRTYKQI